MSKALFIYPTFRQFEEQLSHLPVDNYPKILSTEVGETLGEIRELLKGHSSLTHLHKTVAQKIKYVYMPIIYLMTISF